MSTIHVNPLQHRGPHDAQQCAACGSRAAVSAVITGVPVSLCVEHLADELRRSVSSSERDRWGGEPWQ